MDALCASIDTGTHDAGEEANDELILATIHLTPGFRRRIIDGYARQQNKLIIATLQESSEASRDARMPYYMENEFLYQRQVTSTGDTGRLYIPRALVHDLSKSLHDDSGHQGFDRCMAGLRNFTVHKGSGLLKQYIKHCPHCQRNHTRRHLPYGTLQPILSPAVPYHTVTLDFVLGLPRLPNGNDCVLIVTDEYTKQVGLASGRTTSTARDWAERLLVGAYQW